MAPQDVFDEQAMRQQGGLAVPLYEEELHVERRAIRKGIVRVAVKTRTHEQLVDETLSRERVDVERVAIGRTIESMPDVREEGDLTIIPVVEEILVVERRLVLKEEIRLRRVRTSEPYRETAILRVQDAEISREAPSAASPAGAASAT